MSQARRALIALISVIAVVLGFAPGAFAQSVVGGVPSKAAGSTKATASAVHTKANTPGPGYWLASGAGSVFSNGAADFHGSTGAITLTKPIVGIAATPSGNGYWMVASDGGIFSFGDAAFHGSTGAITLNKPIVGMASTPSGNGYWLVASDGGIFSFGDAKFHGSTGAMTLNMPIAGMATSPTGNGYLLAASDGGIFAFGDAKFHGSTGNITLNKPIVGISSTLSGNGYWMVASDGGIFSFGDAKFFGSTGAIALNQPIVGMAVSPSGNGYWFVAADGGVFSFGDAHFFGSASTQGVGAAIIGMAASAPMTPAAASLDFSTDPSASTGGVAFATQPVVQVLDADGAIVDSTDAVTLSLVSPPTGVVLSCDDNTVHAVVGVATFAGCSINKAGTYTLHATSGSLTPSTSSETITIGAPAQVGFTQQPSSAVSLVNFATQPIGAVQDAGGNTVASVSTGTITLTITTPAGAALTCTSLVVNVTSGLAPFAACHINLSGAYTLHGIYSVGALNGNSNSLSITAAGATKLAFTQSPSNSTGGVAFGTQPIVKVQDASGNTVTGDNSSVVLSLTTANGAALTCTGTTTKQAAAGVATFAGCKIDLANVTPYTLHATDGVLTAAGPSGATTITVGPATNLAFTPSQSATSTGGTAFGTQPGVTVQDAGGNTVTTATGTATLTITAPNTPGGTLTCTTNQARTVTAGVGAAFAGCALDLVGSYTLTATGSGGTIAGLTGVSGTTVVSLGAGSKFVFAATSPSDSTGGVAFGVQPSVTVTDAGGNPTGTGTGVVTMSITTPNTPGGVLTCTTSLDRVVTAGANAAYTGCALTTAGSYSLTATGSGGTVAGFTAVSRTTVIAVGAAASAVFTVEPSATAGSTVAFVDQPSITVRDAGGNLVADGTSVVLSAVASVGGPGVLSCTSTGGLTKATVTGVATYTGCAIAGAGTYTLHAVDGAAVADSAPPTVVT